MQSLLVETLILKQDLLEKQIRDAIVINPTNGTVLAKLIEQRELANVGKPLYTVANLEFLNLRAFVSGDQLANLQIGNTYTVMVDGAESEEISYEGELIWIAETAEFTPKTIQTKKDRVDLVYAIKVRVKNDGKLKLGMPGELWFNEQ